MLLVLWLYFLLKPKQVDTPFDPFKYKKVLTIHDTLYKNLYINKYKKGDSIPYKVLDTIYTHISDTIRIISDYNQVKAYSDTIKKDSNIFVIDDTISQNRIISRGFQAKITTKTILTKEFYANKQTNTLFWGIRGSYSPLNGLEVLSPSLMLSVKNKALIGFSVDISKNYNIGYSGGIYFKIGKK
jgi:hypothetical protein